MRVFGFAAVALWLTGCGQTAEVNAPEAKTPDTKIVEAKPEPPPVPKSIVIPAGTRLSVRTTTAISTKTAATGETFSASLAEAVLADGKVVIPKGAAVEGVVAESDDGGRVKGVASLALRLTHVKTGGKRLLVESGIFTKDAPATKKKDAVKVGIGAGIGAAVGAIVGGGKGAAVGAASGAGAGTALVLATHGDPAVVEAESVLSFRLTKSLTVAP